MYRMENLAKFSAMAELAPEAMTTFQEFDGTALAAGAIPKKYKELVALGIALTTQCPYCLELHREAAAKAGASPMELAEVVSVAAALRAGAAVTHGTHLLQSKVRGAAALAWLMTGMTCSTAFADEGTGSEPAKHAPPPAALVQLEKARAATARFLDVDKAEQEGYVDIGLFVPSMGWHYMKESLVDDAFDAANPELLVYADDPCGGKRQLVAVEYAVPLAESHNAPSGFIGHADAWEVNTEFGLWTLHAWIWEYNLDGVFAPLNLRVATW